MGESVSWREGRPKGDVSCEGLEWCLLLRGKRRNGRQVKAGESVSDGAEEKRFEG